MGLRQAFDYRSAHSVSFRGQSAHYSGLYDKHKHQVTPAEHAQEEEVGTDSWCADAGNVDPDCWAGEQQALSASPVSVTVNCGGCSFLRPFCFLIVFLSGWNIRNPFSIFTSSTHFNMCGDVYVYFLPPWVFWSHRKRLISAQTLVWHCTSSAPPLHLCWRRRERR